MVHSDQAVSEWCTAYCGWLDQCGEQSDPYCPQDCRSSGGFTEYGRPEFYRAMAQCLANDARCVGGADQSWSECYDSVSPTIALSQAAYEFCAAVAPLFFECGYGTVPDTCARNYILFNDKTLNRLQVCKGTSCDAVSDCVRAVAYGGADG